MTEELSHCDMLAECFDDYMDGQLDDVYARALNDHLDSCDACAAQVQRELRIRTLVVRYAEASNISRDDAWFDHALVFAKIAGAKHQSRSSWFRGFAVAGVAIFALWIGSHFFPDGNSPFGREPAPAITMTLEQPQTVNLVFSSATELREASLRLILPDGLQLEGFAGRQDITWMTSLERGQNVLPLRVVATSSHGGEVLAILQHNDDTRMFRLLVSVI